MGVLRERRMPMHRRKEMCKPPGRRSGELDHLGSTVVQDAQGIEAHDVAQVPVGSATKRFPDARFRSGSERKECDQIQVRHPLGNEVEDGSLGMAGVRAQRALIARHHVCDEVQRRSIEEHVVRGRGSGKASDQVLQLAEKGVRVTVIQKRLAGVQQLLVGLGLDRKADEGAGGGLHECRLSVSVGSGDCDAHQS